MKNWWSHRKNLYCKELLIKLVFQSKHEFSFHTAFSFWSSLSLISIDLNKTVVCFRKLIQFHAITVVLLLFFSERYQYFFFFFVKLNIKHFGFIFSGIKLLLIIKLKGKKIIFKNKLRALRDFQRAASAFRLLRLVYKKQCFLSDNSSLTDKPVDSELC